MNTEFENIDTYIAFQEYERQAKLHELRSIIAGIVPIETKETISYGMPTYKFNGNLIHFGQFKKHIGIYPGPDAIEAFKDQLSCYKTSKGAIQIPNEVPLKRKLIESIVLFNVNLLKDKKSPNWTAYRGQWEELYEKMAQLIQKTSLKKEIKWGMDIYTYEGKNVVGWAGFKHFFSIWFYNGVFLADPYKVLVAATEGKTKSLRQWRLQESTPFDEDKILEYINDSIQTIVDGKFIPIERKILEPIGILKEELVNNSDLNKAFNALTTGRQKEYIQYINEAKLDKTKASRLEKIAPMILSGKGLHDKYKL